MVHDSYGRSMRYSLRERNGPLQGAAADYLQSMLHFGFRARLSLGVIWARTPASVGTAFSHECAGRLAKLLKIIPFTE